MKTLLAILIVFGLFLVCVIGAAAQLCRVKRLDDWCTRQLTDTDGQAEEDGEGNRGCVMPGRGSAENAADLCDTPASGGNSCNSFAALSRAAATLINHKS